MFESLPVRLLARDTRVSAVILPTGEAEARLYAYGLMEAAQGEDHAGAGRALISLEQESLRRGWPEAAFLAAAGQLLYSMVRASNPDATAAGLSTLVLRAEAMSVAGPPPTPALLGLALALRALAAAGRGDNAQLLGDAGRAVALVDADDLPALDRCTVLVVCAAAYNTLGLWELVDELYDQAAALEPDCEQPIQAPAIAASRVIIRLEWATALLEQDDEAAATVQLRRAADAARLASSVAGLPRLWQLDIATCREMLALLLDDKLLEQSPAHVDAQLAVLAAFRKQLVELDDVEVVPILDAMVANTSRRPVPRRRAPARFRRGCARACTPISRRELPPPPTRTTAFSCRGCGGTHGRPYSPQPRHASHSNGSGWRTCD
jgi:hypothetical protein